MSEAVIVGAVRSAIGRKKGSLSNTRADELLARVLRGLVERAGVAAREVEDVITGCVTQVGEQGFNVSRNAALMAGFPIETRARRSTGSAARHSRRCTSRRWRSCRGRWTR